MVVQLGSSKAELPEGSAGWRSENFVLRELLDDITRQLELNHGPSDGEFLARLAAQVEEKLPGLVVIEHPKKPGPVPNDVFF